ncbi:MAG TPA: DUF5658 family protein [Blastocatellia bacterium]|nr:DUF5658 family protein [Blastocatellia bacterium]
MSTTTQRIGGGLIHTNGINEIRLILLMLCCFSMSAFDAMATVNHITNGIATEGNPVMNFFLHHGVFAFFLAKTGLTTIALALFYYWRRRNLSRVGLGIALVCYYAVMIYHILIYELMYVH